MINIFWKFESFCQKWQKKKKRNYFNNSNPPISPFLEKKKLKFAPKMRKKLAKWQFSGKFDGQRDKMGIGEGRGEGVPPPSIFCKIKYFITFPRGQMDFGRRRDKMGQKWKDKKGKNRQKWGKIEGNEPKNEKLAEKKANNWIKNNLKKQKCQKPNLKGRNPSKCGLWPHFWSGGFGQRSPPSPEEGIFWNILECFICPKSAKIGQEMPFLGKIGGKWKEMWWPVGGGWGQFCIVCRRKIIAF